MSDPLTNRSSHEHSDADSDAALESTRSSSPSVGDGPQQNAAAHSDHDPLAALEQGLSASALADTPDVNIQEYLAAKKRMQRVTRAILQFGSPFILIGALIVGLKLTGHSILHPGRNRVAPPSGPSFSVTGGGSTATGPLVPVTHTKKDPYIAQDLTDYVEKDLKSISPFEKNALTAFYGVVGQNFRSQTTTFDTVREKVIPDYEKFVAAAQAIHPKTPEVQEIHQLFLRSSQVKLLAFRHLVEGQSDPTGSWQFGVKAEFNASGQFANQFKARIATLAQDQGVKLP